MQDTSKNIYDPFVFNTLLPQVRAILDDLKFCVDSFEKLEAYYVNALAFAKRYLA